MHHKPSLFSCSYKTKRQEAGQRYLPFLTYKDSISILLKGKFGILLADNSVGKDYKHFYSKLPRSKPANTAEIPYRPILATKQSKLTVPLVYPNFAPLPPEVLAYLGDSVIVEEGNSIVKSNNYSR